jgi:hypothetical protein
LEKNNFVIANWNAAKVNITRLHYIMRCEEQQSSLIAFQRLLFECKTHQSFWSWRKLFLRTASIVEQNSKLASSVT